MDVSNLHEREEYRIENTLTVGELIAILQRFDADKKVLITWESTLNELKEEFIYEACTGTLYLDGEGGFYKKYFQRNSL